MKYRLRVVCFARLLVGFGALAVLGNGCVFARPVPESAGPEGAAAVCLDGYRLVTGPIPVDGLPDDVSGVAFNAASRTLFVIMNGEPRIAELDLDGGARRFVELEGFEDTEDLAFVGSDHLAIVEERRRTLGIYPFSSDVSRIRRDAAAEFLIDPVDAQNTGIEGITLVPEQGRLFAVKEKSPRRIYAFASTAAAGDVITHPWDIEASGWGLSDLSSITYDPRSGHLLVLSHESRTIVECTLDGTEVARLLLTAGSAGLDRDIPQPEGIALDDAGRMYICGEPSELYIFEK
jgi:uncharacterized protein YjiK